ncbi:MAG: HIR complex subunit [Claussenomyces sp. TS43310]|nr:MAG: HIR complex subunit [Claussenomyces sp. TS43310]
MRFIRPSWLSHSGEQKDFEVYSCHVSPDGTRLATAAGDGYVRIWSIDAVENAGDASYTKPKQLCHLSKHSGSVTVVRFSRDGRWLASGADDKVICIYELDYQVPAAPSFGNEAHLRRELRKLILDLGTSEPPPVENWKIVKRLIGHDNDVQDLGWSYDSSILVSVGLDSKIVVWSGHTFEKLKTLSVHQSHVKGITFDPANKYFATASDDRTIRIFRFTSPAPNATSHDMVNNFVFEHNITTPFKSSPLTTYFRRCSWSPDGNHIAAANSVNGPVSSVAIINRGVWDSEITLIGHEGPVEVASFSPRLYSDRPPNLDNTDNSGFSTLPLVTVIACAGQDKALTVWNTSTSRPLVIVQDLASKSISDLSWSPDGLTLFATSLDGSVVAVVFEPGDLGFVARIEENDKALQKFGASRKGVGVIEDVAGLLLEERSKAGELRGAEGRMGALMGDANVAKSPTINGGGVSKLSNGETSSSANTPAAIAPAPSIAPAQVNGTTPAINTNAEKLEKLKQRVTITKEGRKRVAPMLVSSSGTGQSSLPQSQLVASNANNSNAMETPQSLLDLSKPYDGLPRGGLSAMLLGNKRKVVAIEAEDDEHSHKRQSVAGLNGIVPIMTNGVDGVEPATSSAPQQGIVPTPEFIRPAVISPAMTVSQVRLAVPKIRSHILRSLNRGGTGNAVNGADDTTKVTDDVIFEAKNPSLFRDPARISATKRGTVLWQDFLPRSVILVTGNKNFWSAACEDGSIYTWTPAGRRLLNALIVEAQPVIFECRGWWLLCITATGTCHVWNLKTLSSPHPPVSLAPVLDIAIHSLQAHPTVGPGVTSAHLNSSGHVVVTLNNGDGYAYSPGLYIWQRMSEAWWAVGSQYWNSNDSSISSLQSTAVGSDSQRLGQLSTTPVSAGIIPHLERHTTNEVLLRGRAFPLQRLFKTLLAKEGFESFESDVSIAHLENRVAAAMQLESKEDFRLYLFMYAKRLGAEGMKGKVEELLRSLLGGILTDGESSGTDEDGKGWQSVTGEICGWERKDLLKGVVLILGKFRELQRMTVQYARVLDMVNDEDGEPMVS